jgi:aryl-alcohol dehydrogenase-like predicted oxidoreductase
MMVKNSRRPYVSFTANNSESVVLSHHPPRRVHFHCRFFSHSSFLFSSGINAVYGNGLSEQFVGEFMRETDTQPFIATKFAPLPWRQTPGSLVAACEASCRRLGVKKVGLYLQHWPGFLFNAFANDAYLEGLAMVREKGLADAVGVSNFNAARVKQAASTLASRGASLACNQVQYNLLYRAPERNGVLEACRENGVSLVAYSPICQGLLSGKYSKDNPPQGPRRFIFTDQRYSSVTVLLDLMKRMGEERGGITPTQIALNWTLCKGTIPIPGAKNANQVRELAGALGWRLSDGEVAELDAASGKIPTSLGAPFENW